MVVGMIAALEMAAKPRMRARKRIVALDVGL